MAAQGSNGPRVRVAAFIMLDGRVVLVRHRAGSSVYHLLPGGGVDYRETLADALVREVAEETGLSVRPGRPLLINDTIDPTGTRHVVNITFEAHVTGGQVTSRPEDDRVEAVELVEPDRLHDLDLRPPFAPQLLDVLREGPDYRTAYLGSLFTEGR